MKKNLVLCYLCVNGAEREREDSISLSHQHMGHILSLRHCLVKHATPISPQTLQSPKHLMHKRAIPPNPAAST